MTTPRDPNADADRLISAFLAEGQAELPDQVYDEVRAEVDHTDQRTFIGPWRTSFVNRFVTVAAVAVVMVVAVIVGLQLGGGPHSGGNPSLSPSPSGASVATASVTEGDYRLTITSPRETWGTDDAIDVEAAFEYVGPESTDMYWAAADGPLDFRVVEVSGDREMGDAFPPDCPSATDDGDPQTEWATHILTGEPFTRPYEKSGGYGPDDPNAAFYEDFFTDPLLHLPVGEWQVTALATFDPVNTCVPTAIRMAASITLTIEASGEPSVSAEPSPSVGTLSCCAPGDTSPVGPGPFVLWDDVHGGYNVTVAVPNSGWAGAENQHVLLLRDNFGPGNEAGLPDPPDGAGLFVFQGGDVPPDPCAWLTTPWPDTTETVGGYVAAFASQASRDASEAVDIEVAGHPGKAITLHVPDDGVFSDCDQGYFVTLTAAVFGNPLPVVDRYAQGPGQIDEFWIVDVAGHVVMFDLAFGRETPQAVIDDMRAMVESATFGTSFE